MASSAEAFDALREAGLPGAGVRQWGQGTVSEGRESSPCPKILGEGVVSAPPPGQVILNTNTNTNTNTNADTNNTNKVILILN